MVDTEFLFKYTTALYAAPVEIAPRYDEFRDMFSRGQVLSKVWLVEELRKVLPENKNRILIVGSWFGTLSFLIKKYFTSAQITCLDQDERCKKFIDILASQTNDLLWLEAVTQDMFKYSISEEVVINTGCEHISDVTKWLESVPSHTWVALQSTDYAVPTDHINCFSSLASFEKNVSSTFEKIYFSGEFKFDMYTRFMIIGLKK